MSKEMTTEQKILQFIKDYKKENGYVPTQSDIARKFEMSRQNIRLYFQKLAPKLQKYSEYKRYTSVLKIHENKGEENGTSAKVD